MKRNTKEYTIYNAVTPQTVTSSTDATPIVVTKSSHGYSTGDLIVIYGHTTNIAANGIFKIVKVDANSFQLRNRYTGAAVAGSGATAGADGIMCLAPKIIDARDFKNCILTVNTAGTATFTFKVAGSNGLLDSDATADGDTPNFGGTISKSNPYTFLQIVNLDTATAVNGATGIAASGTDLNINYEVNVNAIKYFTLIPTAWTQGSITVKALLTTED